MQTVSSVGARRLAEYQICHTGRIMCPETLAVWQDYHPTKYDSVRVDECASDHAEPRYTAWSPGSAGDSRFSPIARVCASCRGYDRSGTIQGPGRRVDDRGQRMLIPL